MKKILILLAVTLIGCTDTEMAHLASLGSSGSITCYSGGKVIYDGVSTGKIWSTEQSDGWEFKDAKTGHLVRLSGDCVIVN